MCTYIRTLNYSKFTGSFFIDFSCNLECFVVLELFNSHLGVVPEDSVNHEVAAVVFKIVSVVFQSSLNLFDDCAVFASFLDGFPDGFDLNGCLFGGLFVVVVAFKGYCGLEFACFVKLGNLECGFAFGVGFCLVFFSVDFKVNPLVFQSLAVGLKHYSVLFGFCCCLEGLGLGCYFSGCLFDCNFGSGVGSCVFVIAFEC